MSVCDGISLYDYPGGVHCHGCPEHPHARPVSDPSETLALIETHGIALNQRPGGGWWFAERNLCYGEGSTIGEAVRACVERIRSGQ